MPQITKGDTTLEIRELMPWGRRVLLLMLGVFPWLAAAKLKNIFPQSLILIGIQPEKIEISTDLIQTIQDAIDPLLTFTIEQLEVWGRQIVRRV